MPVQPSHPPSAPEEHYSEKEAAQRRDAALLRALSTPHKRQAEMKVGKSDASPKKRGRPTKERHSPTPD
jgi:hypothetical protein